MTRTTSVIIPAFNEGERIKNVIEPLLNSKLTDEIIVVDDFSTDNTSEVASKYPRVKVIRMTENIGKTKSILEGVNNSKGEYLLFLDADLIGLTSDDIDNLIRPVINGDADQTISFRKKEYFFFTYIIPGNPILSGEKCMNKADFYKIMGSTYKSGYDFELSANKYFLDNNKAIAVVIAESLNNTMKFKKRGFITGWVGDFKMATELIITFGVFEMIRQVFTISYKFHLLRLIRHKNILYLNNTI